MPRQIEMFPAVAVVLQQEIVEHHPELCKRLQLLGNVTLQEKVAFVAHYCNYGIDGWFGEKEMEALFELLLKRLREMSTQTIITIN